MLSGGTVPVCRNAGEFDGGGVRVCFWKYSDRIPDAFGSCVKRKDRLWRYKTDRSDSGHGRLEVYVSDSNDCCAAFIYLQLVAADFSQAENVGRVSFRTVFVYRVTDLSIFIVKVEIEVWMSS